MRPTDKELAKLRSASAFLRDVAIELGEKSPRWQMCHSYAETLYAMTIPTADALERQPAPTRQQEDFELIEATARIMKMGR